MWFPEKHPLENFPLNQSLSPNTILETALQTTTNSVFYDTIVNIKT